MPSAPTLRSSWGATLPGRARVVGGQRETGRVTVCGAGHRCAKSSQMTRTAGATCRSTPLPENSRPSGTPARPLPTVRYAHRGGSRRCTTILGRVQPFEDLTRERWVRAPIRTATRTATRTTTRTASRTISKPHAQPHAQSHAQTLMFFSGIARRAWNVHTSLNTYWCSNAADSLLPDVCLATDTLLLRPVLKDFHASTKWASSHWVSDCTHLCYSPSFWEVRPCRDLLCGVPCVDHCTVTSRRPSPPQLSIHELYLTLANASAWLHRRHHRLARLH